MGFLICVLELLVESLSNSWKFLLMLHLLINSYHVVSRVLGVFLCVWVVFGTFNSRTLYSCSLISYTLPLLSLALCFYCIWAFLDVFNCCKSLCLCHFDFWISISFVKVMFLPKCHQFYVVLFLIILVDFFYLSVVLCYCFLILLLNQVVFNLWRIQTLWRMLKPRLCLLLLCWFSLVLG